MNYFPALQLQQTTIIFRTNSKRQINKKPNISFWKKIWFSHRSIPSVLYNFGWSLILKIKFILYTHCMHGTWSIVNCVIMKSGFTPMREFRNNA